MGWTEIAFLVVLGVIIFGPEKLPDVARKAARVLHYLRGVANNARTQLNEELGPEFANLDLRDLNPKTFVRKHLLEEGEVIVREVSSAKTAMGEIPAAITTPAPAPAAAVPEGPTPFDPEAT